MFDIGGGELLVILLIVLVLFGPKKLPELMQGLGRGMREFKRAQREFTEQINTAFEDDQRRTHNLGAQNAPNTVPRVPSYQPQPSEVEGSDIETPDRGSPTDIDPPDPSLGAGPAEKGIESSGSVPPSQ